MNHLRPYKLFEALSTGFWEAVDEAADRIASGSGYGKPIRGLIDNVPEFGIVKFGRQICDPDVLFDRWHKLKQKNQIMKNVTIGEKVSMLLQHWDSLGHGFNHLYNPKKLKFSQWYNTEQTLYRGMSVPDMTELNKHAEGIIDRGVLDEQPFYSFSFDPDIAEKFTIAGYASGGFVRTKFARGYVFKTEVAPAEFHIFMGGMLSDEMEVVLKSPVKVELHKKVGIDPF